MERHELIKKLEEVSPERLAQVGDFVDSAASMIWNGHCGIAHSLLTLSNTLEPQTILTPIWR
jgi:hypothetical protein